MKTKAIEAAWMMLWTRLMRDELPALRMPNTALAPAPQRARARRLRALQVPRTEALTAVPLVIVVTDERDGEET